MPTEARIVVLPPGDQTLQLREVNLPDPGPHEVVVRQHASGVCHSQLHQMHGPRNNPVLLGHESTGTVIATGSDVTHVEEGDEVMVTWVPRSMRPGGRVPNRATLDLGNGLRAVSRNVFTWADHTIADEQFVVQAPPGTPSEVGAIIGCAVMTGAGAVLNTASVSEGQSVAIFGVGGVGLCAVAAARHVGAAPIIAVDLDDAKLDLARRFGATHVVNAKQEDPVAAIRSLTRHEDRFDSAGSPVAGADATFDCIGLEVTMGQILAAARSGAFGLAVGGLAVLVGVPTTTLALDTRDVMVNEKRFIGSIGGSCSPDRDFPLFVDWHRDGSLDLDALVTERFPLDQVNEAAAALEAGRIRGRAILVMDT